jgi:hypothetical protein
MNWTFSALHQKCFSFLDFYVISYSTFITTHQNGFSNFYKRYNQKLIKPVKWNHEPKSKICFSKANCGVDGDGERAWSWCSFEELFIEENNLLQWISITWADFLRNFSIIELWYISVKVAIAKIRLPLSPTSVSASWTV